MAAVAAPAVAQEVDQESAQATVRDSAKMVKPMLPEVPMREIKGRVYDNATKQPTAVSASLLSMTHVMRL